MRLTTVCEFLMVPEHFSRFQRLRVTNLHRKISKKSNNWKSAILNFPFQHQSNLTNKIAEEILIKGRSKLPSYGESSVIHIPIIKSFLEHFNLFGNKDNEIYKFLTERYGDFILLKPPLKLNTLALWFLPFIFLVIGILIIFFHNKKSKKN